MSDLDSLFVPVEMDALVINVEISGQGKPMAMEFNLNVRNYNNLKNFETPEPNPFDGGPPEKGIHLHWTLPRGLRHGYEIKKGDPDSLRFPYLPNRWLVLRQTMTPANQVSTTGWVLASDQFVDKGSKNAAPFVNMTGSAIGKQIKTPCLGKTLTIDEWVQKQGEAALTPIQPFLTALGVNDVTFTTYAPGSRGITSFHDDMAGVPDQSYHTYLLIGWYSTQEMDPLHGAQVKQEGQKLNSPIWWEVDESNKMRKVAQPVNWRVELGSDIPPNRTILHSMLYGIVWDTSNTNPANDDYPYKPQNYPNNVTDQVNVAVGKTFADAISALIRHKAQQAGVEQATLEGRLLEAFQYNLLEKFEEPGGGARLDLEIHNRSFGTTPGDVCWNLENEQPDDTSQLKSPSELSPEQRQQLAELEDIQRQRLAALNVAQRRLNIERRRLQSMQWQLYAYWFQFYQLKIKNGGYFDDSVLQDPDPYDDEDMNVAISLLSRTLGQAFDEADHLPDQVRDQILKVKMAHQEVEKAKDQVQVVNEEIASLNQSVVQQLKPVPIDPFWHPNDPVLLITGLGRSEKFRQNKTLDCRRANDLLTGLSVIRQGRKYTFSLIHPDNLSQDIRVKNISRLLPGLPADWTKYLPPGVNELIKEAFLLNPTYAALITKAGFDEADEAAIHHVRAVIEKPTVENVVGIPPSDFAAKAWQQPWKPLYLDWQVKYHFIYNRNRRGHFAQEHQNWGNYEIDFSGWVFPYKDNHEVVNDYHWAGEKIDHNSGKSYHGRTFLTPAAHFTFIERLLRYVETHHDKDNPADRLLANAENLLEQLEKWDILSQSLSGLLAFLVLRDTRLHHAPPKSKDDPSGYFTDRDTLLASLLEDPLNPGSFPALQSGAPYYNLNQDDDYPPPLFFPILAGYLEIEKIRVTDSFGATQDLIGSNSNYTGNSDAFQPILPELLTANSKNSGRLIRMAPRIIQPSRLAFRYVDANNDNWEVGLMADTSPICGWILPNHINTALTVYDEKGRLLGQVIYTEQQVIWRPAPGNEKEAPVINPENRPDVDCNIHLQKLLQQLVTLTPDTFQDFILTVDETLWTIDPLGVRDDQNLSVLIGRPLAVVRANLQLQLQGFPLADQCYRQMFHYNEDINRYEIVQLDGGLSKSSFPVKLGFQELRNDGLIGYFQGADYAHFNAVHMVEGMRANTFIRHIGDPIAVSEGKTRPNHLYLKPTSEVVTVTPGTFDTTNSEYVTMIIDPRGSVHALSGILPVKTLQLPAALVEPALAQMVVTFNVGPIIREATAVRMPRPAERRGNWQWIQATGTNPGDWQIEQVNPAGIMPHMNSARYIMQEGWLKFSPEDKV